MDLFFLRLAFGKLLRQIFMTRVEVWVKDWAKNLVKFSGHVCASFAVRNDPAKPKILSIFHSMSCG